ncbi:MAG: prepilin-type N-terminal cleavage/methylation domain-containing protein [Bdellovibrionales bacterium]|nr:prepilin-type N-terminal cleavage/methylation domain-containing protein [Bdellovibrionales bacterium]
MMREGHISLRVSNRAFSLVEIMVALVLLAIGLLGMAGMTMLVMRGGRQATDTNSLTDICNFKLEELKDIEFDNIGSADGSDPEDEQRTFGLEAGAVVQYGDLSAVNLGVNTQGLTRVDLYAQEAATAGSECEGVAITNDDCADFLDQSGPYKYQISFVVCDGQEYDALGTPPIGTSTGSNADSSLFSYRAEPYCLVDPSDPTSRVEDLACLSTDILNPGISSVEKAIKIICATRDERGRCYYAPFKYTKVDT